MRIAVFSDTHGRISKCIKEMERFGKVDMIIHLGDVMRDAEDLKAYYENIPVESVSGNCEIAFAVNTEKTIEVMGKRIFMTHGHNYNVKRNLVSLAQKVKEENADIGLFGHTHIGFDGVVDGVRLLNPGSISLPAEGPGSSGIIEIEDDKIKTTIVEVIG